jgi:hypothetical protein
MSAVVVSELIGGLVLRDLLWGFGGGGAVRGLVGIEGGVVSGVSNLESPGWSAGLETTPCERYYEARAFAVIERCFAASFGRLV